MNARGPARNLTNMCEALSSGLPGLNQTKKVSLRTICNGYVTREG
jgi:hypothetical protein